MLVNHLFNLRRVDILATADKHILFAVDDKEIAFGVETGHIARVEVAALVHGGGGRCGVVEITRAVGFALQHQFALLVGAEELVVVIHNLGVDEKVRAANRTGFANGVFGGQGKDAGAKLGHAKALLEADAFFGGVFFHQRNRQRRATRCAETQRRQIRFRPVGGRRQHLVHGRDSGENGHFVALKQRQHLGGVEGADEDGRPAKNDLRQGIDEQPAGVEHRENVEIDVIVGHIMDDGVERVPGNHAVRNLGGFGQAGRTAGKNQRGDILGFERFAGDGGSSGGLEGGFKGKATGEAVSV